MLYLSKKQPVTDRVLPPINNFVLFSDYYFYYDDDYYYDDDDYYQELIKPPMKPAAPKISKPVKPKPKVKIHSHRSPPRSPRYKLIN